ncbi:MAG TPA: LuxR C-terminal-related transcriptional regulator [Candidatus Sulfotelmatobacter sp.]|jgi:DNA-binding CsgD family transcriptional regulator|nr:LuxR C-terminal-related transcriptional regulator [Candidatus Sulfotelmatobacter sp.]
MKLRSSADYELLLECIRELHSLRDVDSVRAWLLDHALPRLVPSDWLSYNEVDLAHPENTVAILKPDSKEFFQNLFPRFQELAHQHPLITRQMQLADFSVHKISDFLSQKSFHRLELYRDVYRHMHVEYQIAATIKLEPERITAFALARRQKDYTERDRTILELLRPHLVVALNNLTLADKRQTILDSTELVLKGLSSATIIVDRQNQVLYHTGPGLKWIGADPRGVLPSQISGWLAEAATSSRQTMTLNTDAGEIEIRFVPTGSPQRRLLVLTAGSRHLVPVQTNDFGLSKRELEIARWIGDGKKNTEIARILGISPRTVQKHIEHIFEKMGVKTRVAVASKLLFFPKKPVAP